MERKRILKRLYGEPPTFDPAQVEELLRGVDTSSVSSIELSIAGVADEDIYNIHGRPYLRVVEPGEEDTEAAWIDPDGDLLGSGFNYVSKPIMVKDWFGFFARKGDAWFFIQGNGSQLEFKDGQPLQAFWSKGELQFIVDTGAGAVLVDRTGKQKSMKYDSIWPAETVGDQDPSDVAWGYVFARRGNNLYVLNDEGEEMTPPYRSFDQMVKTIRGFYFSGTRTVDGKDVTNVFDLDGNAIFRDDLIEIGQMMVIYNELYFCAKREEDEKWVVVDQYGGRPQKRFSKQPTLFNADGQLFIISDSGVYDEMGDPVGLHNATKVKNPVEVGGELYYLAKQDQKWVPCRDYEILLQPTAAGYDFSVHEDELFIIDKQPGKARLYDHNGDELTETYYTIFDVTERDGKGRYYFFAQKEKPAGGKPNVFIVSSDERELGPYTSARSEFVNERPYFVVEKKAGFYVIDASGNVLNEDPYEDVRFLSKADEDHIWIVGIRKNILYQQYVNVT